MKVTALNVSPRTVPPPAQDENRRGSDVCSTCAEKYLNLGSNPGMHRCSACLMEFVTEMWSSEILRNHNRFTRKLVCKSCVERGCTPLNLTLYACCDRKHSFGHSKFDTNDLSNAKERNRMSALRCLHCKTLVECTACQIGYEKSYWSATELKMQKKPRYSFGVKRLPYQGLHAT